jgi:hypothetical protein
LLGYTRFVGKRKSKRERERGGKRERERGLFGYIGSEKERKHRKEKAVVSSVARCQ